MITLDTSGVYALVNARDPDHERAATALRDDQGPYLVPAGVLGEITYLIENRLGIDVLDAFLSDIESGGLTVDCGDRDISRVRELVRRYENLPLGFADATVVACAERSGGRVLTLDVRDFGVVAGEGTIQLAP